MPETDRTRFFALDPEVGRCPYGVFAELRDEPGLVWDEALGAHAVTRHADILRVLKDGETFASTDHVGPKLAEAVRTFDRLLAPEDRADIIVPFELADIDGDAHRRLRGFVNGSFSKAAVARREPAVRAVCREVVDRVRDRDRIEFVHDVARPVAILSVARILGLADEDLPTFERWFACLFAFIEEAHITSAVVDDYVAAGRQVQRYVAERAAELRERPDDSVLSHMVHADRDGDRPTEREMASLCLGMLAGTSETTAAALCSAVVRLAEDPSLADELRADPDRLIPAFVNETLRLHSPIQGIFRTTTRPVTLSGTELPQGAYVYLMYGAGNRDEAVFPKADAMDLDRPGSPPHLAMGAGAHRCLGTYLGLAQLRIALEELLTAVDSFELAVPLGDLPFRHRYINPGYAELPVTLRRVPART